MEKGLAISLRGNSHKQNGKPMQDYSGAVKGDGYNIAIVCDGHGSDKHFRSHVGSRLATEAAQAKLIEFAQANPDYATASKNFGAKAERLKLSILSAWMKGIDEDQKETPFTEKELSSGVPQGTDYFAKYTKLVPYGSTMLAVLLGSDYYVALMIGDGVILRMTPDKNVEEEAFEGKKLGDRVESLCNQDAAYKIYTKCVKIEEADKDMAFILCSDGFCESEAFTAREQMREWTKRYIVWMAKYDAETVVEQMTKQMEHISAVSYAKDDISVAIAVKDPSAYWDPTPEELQAMAEAEAQKAREQEEQAKATEEASETAQEETQASETEQAVEAPQTETSAGAPQEEEKETVESIQVEETTDNTAEIKEETNETK